MLVKEFVELLDNNALYTGHTLDSDFCMEQFIEILDEFRDEKCSVLLGKIMASMPADFQGRLELPPGLSGKL